MRTFSTIISQMFFVVFPIARDGRFVRPSTYNFPFKTNRSILASFFFVLQSRHLSMFCTLQFWTLRFFCGLKWAIYNRDNQYIVFKFLDCLQNISGFIFSWHRKQYLQIIYNDFKYQLSIPFYRFS